MMMKSRKRLLWILGVVVFAVAATIVTGVLYVQSRLGSLLQQYAKRNYGLTLRIGAAELQFHPLALRLESVEISSPEQSRFFSARSVSASLPYSSLWKDEFLVNSMTLESPSIDLNHLPERPVGAESKSAPPRFRLERLEVSSGTILAKGYELREIALDARLDNTGAKLREARARFRNTDLGASGTIDSWEKPRVRLSYDVRGSTQDFMDFMKNPPPVKGPFAARGTIEGDVSRPVLTGNVTGSNFSWEGSPPFTAAAQFSYDPGAPEPIRLEAEWNSAPLKIARHYLQNIPATSSLCAGNLKYAGDSRMWSGNGNARVGIVAAGRDLPVSGEIRASLHAGRIDIENADVRWRSTTAHAFGTLKENELSVTANLKTSSAGDLSFLQPALAKVPGAYSAQAQISGPYSDLQIHGNLQGTYGKSGIAAEITMLMARKAVSLQFHGAAAAAEWRPWIPQLENGTIDFEGSASGSLQNPSWTIRASGAELRAGSFAIGRMTLGAEGNGPQAQFQAEAPDIHLAAEGSYQLMTKVFSIHGSLENISLSELGTATGQTSVPLAGNIRAEFQSSGDLDRWKEATAEVTVDRTELRYREAAIRLKTARARTEHKNVILEVEAEAHNATLTAGGTISMERNHEVNLQVNGTIAAGALENVTRDWKGEGSVRIDSQVHGTLAQPEFDGKVESENLAVTYLPRNLRLGMEHLLIAFTRNGIALQGLGRLNEATLSLSGLVPVKSEAGNLRLEVSGFPLSTLQENSGFSGTLNATVDLRGKGFPLSEWRPGALKHLPFHEWTGEISVTSAGLALKNNPITAEGPLRLQFADGVMRLLPARLTSGDLVDLQASGGLNLDTGKVDAAVQMNARIDLLSNLRADLQSSGPLTCDFRIGGTIENPTYKGNLALNHASIRIPNFPLFLEDLNLEASLDERALSILKLQARAGGGTLTGGGEVIKGKAGSQITIQGRNVALLYPEGLRSQLNFDLQLSAQQSDYLLSGNVDILRSFYEQQLTLRNPIVRKLLASRRELGAEKQFRNRIKLDLSIRTVQDLQLKNNMASLRGGARLTLSGSLYRPLLKGRIGVHSGSRLYLQGNEFDVEKADIIFYGDEALQPDLDVTLFTLLRDSSTDTYYEVYLPFGGSLSNIEFRNVRSNPSLSEDQIYSLITQGTTESEQTGLGAAALQRQILSFMAGQALSAPSAAVARSLGLSRIQFQQEGLNASNDNKTRMVLGKDIGAGFTLVYSVALNEPEDQTWIASYRYGRNIVGRFIDQSDGTVTASVSHRVQFGKGQKPSGRVFRAKETGPRISGIQIVNQSAIPDNKIREMLQVTTGGEFDYWDFQDQSQKLLRQIQNLGYLSPSVDVREEESGNQVALRVEIRQGLPGSMVFHGGEISNKQREYYLSLWSQGLSPTIAQQYIERDLLHQLRLAGYDQATVTSSATTSGERTDYHFFIAPGMRFTRLQLDFQGSGHYKPAVLEADLRSLCGSSAEVFVEAIHDFQSFQEKIQALYLQDGYIRTNVAAGPVQYLPKESKIVRKIMIEEGPLSRVVAVAASDGRALPEALVQQLLLRPQEPFSPDGIVEDELKIRNFYQAEGHEHLALAGSAEFEENTSDIRVKWNLDKGPVSRIAHISVSGNQTTRTGLILKVSKLREGGLLTPQARSLARKGISDLGVFQQIAISEEETGTPGTYDVSVRVVENKRFEVQYGARYNTDDKAGGEVRLSDANLFGHAQNLNLYVRYSVDLPIYRVDYILPVAGTFWDRTRFSFFHDVRDEDVSATVSGEFEKLPFRVTETQFQLQQDFRLGKLYRFIWGFDYGDEAAKYEDPEDRTNKTAKGTVTRLHSALIADHRDDPLNATRGYFYSADAEYAPSAIGSDISYGKFYSQFFVYHKFGPLVSATGARAGFLTIRSNVLAISEKFRTGGSSTLRGFGENQVVPGEDAISIFFGGNSVFIFNQELRFPIYKWISGGVFYDAGNVYRLAGDFDVTNLRNSAGFGVRVGSGSFLLRLDLGFNLNPVNEEPREVFHFAIGQAF